jgi:hypothetical protein
LPVNEQDIRTALAHLKLYPILTGYRGKAGADLGPVVSAILAVQDYVQANLTQLAEVEINPLIAQAHGAVAVDALIRKDLE